MKDVKQAAADFNFELGSESDAQDRLITTSFLAGYAWTLEQASEGLEDWAADDKAAGGGK